MPASVASDELSFMSDDNRSNGDPVKFVNLEAVNRVIAKAIEPGCFSSVELDASDSCFGYGGLVSDFFSPRMGGEAQTKYTFNITKRVNTQEKSACKVSWEMLKQEEPETKPNHLCTLDIAKDEDLKTVHRVEDDKTEVNAPGRSMLTRLQKLKLKTENVDSHEGEFNSSTDGKLVPDISPKLESNLEVNNMFDIDERGTVDEKSSGEVSLLKRNALSYERKTSKNRDSTNKQKHYSDSKMGSTSLHDVKDDEMVATTQSPVLTRLQKLKLEASLQAKDTGSKQGTFCSRNDGQFVSGNLSVLGDKAETDNPFNIAERKTTEQNSSVEISACKTNTSSSKRKTSKKKQLTARVKHGTNLNVDKPGEVKRFQDVNNENMEAISPSPSMITRVRKSKLQVPPQTDSTDHKKLSLTCRKTSKDVSPSMVSFVCNGKKLTVVRGCHRSLEKSCQHCGCLEGSGSSWKTGTRRSTRIRSRPLEFWRGERFLQARICECLPTVIGIKYTSSDTRRRQPDEKPKVVSYVDRKYYSLVKFAGQY